jgi:hypothetical protein
MDKSLITILALIATNLVAFAQTHTMPGSNLVPSGASLTIQSGGSITAAAGSTVAGFGNPLQWDGGATSLVPATGRISLGLVIGTNVQAWNTNLDTWASKTPFAGSLTITTGKTLNAINTLTLSSTDGSTLNIGAGGTLGSAAFTAASAYEVPLTFSQSLSRATNTVTLSGDSTSPGNTMLYGTNGSGIKGWYAQPAGGGSGANPTAKVGISAVNGSASTFMRSDAAPPIDQTVDLAMTAAQTETVTDTATGITTDILALGRNSAGTPGVGFGPGLLFKGKSDTTINRLMGEISSAWLTAADGTRESVMRIQAANAAGLPGSYIYVFANGGLSNTNNNPGSGVINSTNGFMVATAVPASGKFMQSNGNANVQSSYALPTTAGGFGYTLRSDNANIASYPQDILNSSVSSQSPSTSDVYLAGSNVPVVAGDYKAKGQYRCLFDVTKTAGTGAIVLSVRVGTAGGTGDPAVLTFTFGAGTSVADTGIFEVIVTWRTVGSGTSAVVQGICRATHNLATTGLFNNAADWSIVAATSSGFNSSTATNMGVSFNGSTAFAGTITVVQATLLQ